MLLTFFWEVANLEARPSWCRSESRSMKTIIIALLAFLSTLFRSRAALQLEIVALRHQLTVYQRTTRRPRIQPADRMFWSWLSRCWSGWRSAQVFVQPRTVIAWQRKRFRDHWAKLSQQGRPGRPAVSKEIKALIRKISVANPSWGSPRIVGELRKLGIDVAKSTVDKYRLRSKQPPSPTWKTFMKNHVTDLVSIDFFVVPTARFKVLFVLVVLAHHRRRVVHFNVTEHPTAQWTRQQIVEGFPWDTAPEYLLRDRDAAYGSQFQKRVKSLGIEEVLTAPHSPWQKGYASHCTSFVRIGGTLK
jgi:putative transposase